MIVERIIMENLGVQLKMLPLCTEEDAGLIESFIPRAREGFALTLKPNRVLPGETKKLLEQTTPLTTPAHYDRVQLLEEENTLPEYNHTLATLAYLLNLKKVTYYDFQNPPKDVGDELGFIETYWNFNTFSVDHVWSLMIEIERITRAALYQEKPMEVSELVKAGHFYTAGNELSKIFSI